MAGQVGQQIGNYRLVLLLGQGSFGNVYLAKHLHLQTQAAVKLLHQRVEAHESNAFLQEARIIASLKHDHILRVLDFGFEQGMPYLVTEYAPNGTLRQRHPRGSLVPVAMILSYVQQIAQALQYAHNQELIHRDIKPENILFDEHGRVVLSDFGIALKGSRKLTEKDIAGTATYMAPEVFQGKPRRASDQYALGIMVYEWLTGRPPFQGDFYGLVGQHLTSPVPPLTQVPAEVAKVVYQALEKAPEDRFPTITAFAYAFEQAVKGKPVVRENLETRSKPADLQSSRIPPAVSPTNAVAKTLLFPRHGFVYAFLSGLIAGLLWYGVSSIFYFGFVMTTIPGGIICCLAGFVTGKAAVARKMGWITGIVAGLSLLIPVLVRTSFSIRLLELLVFTLLIFLITVSFTFGGIWLATRTHPYYRRAKPSRGEYPNSR